MKRKITGGARAAGRAENLMDGKISYAGRDLEAMSFAVNYHRWILSVFSPYLGARLVEVGAGTGLFSELLLGHPAQSLALVEPSADMHRILRDRVGQLRPGAEVETFNAVFVEVAGRLKARRPDSIIYVNVLEHVADDDAELTAVRQTLGRGGRAFIFVPALPRLYGNFDRQVGHFRRYTKSGLEGKCRRAGFEIIKSTYFDLAGVIPWWVQFRLLKGDTLRPGAVRLYDKYAVPITRAVESVIRPPLGKNLLLIAEKVY